MARKSTAYRIMVITISIILFSCASKDFKEPGEIKQPKKRTARTYSANFAKTWNAVSSAASQYPVISSKKESGIIVTDWIKDKSDRLYSGYGETRVPYTIRYRFTVKVKPTSKGTMVNVTSKEQYFTDSVTSGIDFSGSLYQLSLIHI